MSEKTRTDYSIKNASVALIGKILVLLFAYAARVVFVRVLNETYAGANGLLNNVLATFSLSSLGIDSALVFLLYVPIIKNDIPRQRVLFREYNKIHLLTGGVIAAIAAAIYAAMPLISAESLDVPGFHLIYWLFAGNIIMCYVWAHKPMIFIASQQSYVIEIFESLQFIIQYALQIAVLLLTKSFILYTVVFFFSIIFKNVALTAYANRKYPYLKEKSSEKLEKEDKTRIRKNLWAILVQKFGVKLINFTDTLILSGFFGIVSIAKYANYSLILASVTQLLDKVIYSLTGSIGNLGATSEKDDVHRVYRASFFIISVIYGVISIGLFESIDLFVQISFGEIYVYQRGITLVLCINFYLNGIRAITNVFRNSLGLFWHDRYRSIIEAVANVVFSLLMIKLFGEIGIFIGTTLSLLSVPFWIEPLVLFKNYFKVSLMRYFLQFALYTAAMFGAGFICDRLCALIVLPPVPAMIVRLAVSAVVPLAVVVVFFHSTSEFKFAVGIIKRMLGKLRPQKAK